MAQNLDFDIIANDRASADVGRVAAAMQRLDRSTNTVNRSHHALATTTGHVSSGFSRIARVAGAVAGSYAAIKVGQFAKDSIRAASDLEEATAATGVMFGKNKDAIISWANTAAQAFGQSRTQAQQSATYFGTLGKAAGLTGRDLVGFSKQMTTLGSDLASFFNTSPQEAIDALGSGLRGESEPLRRFGVLLDDATLKARAMKMGIYSGTGTLTQQQKVLAAHAEILKQTNKAQGDFARTQGGWANQTRTFSAQLENLKATAGKALLPIATDYLKRINQAMPELEAGIKKVAPVIGRALRELGGGQGFGSLADAADAMKSAWPEIADILRNVGEAGRKAFAVIKWLYERFDSLPPGVKDTAIQLGAIAAALGFIGKRTGAGGAIKMSIDFTTSIAKAVSSIAGSFLRAMVVKAGVVYVNGTVAGGKGVPTGGGAPRGGGSPSGGGVPGVVGGGLAALGAAAASIAVGVAIPAIVAKVGNELADRFPQLTRNTRGQNGGVTGGSTNNPVPGRFGRIPSGNDNLPSWWTSSQTYKQLQQNAAGLKQMAANLHASAAAAKGYRGALNAADDQAKRSEAGIRGNSQAAVQNKMALFQQATAAQRVMGAMRQSGASADALTAKQRSLGQAFIANARDMGVPASQARSLARAYGLLPPRKDTHVGAPGAKDSKRDIDAHNRSANNTPGRKDTHVGAPGAKDSKRDIDAHNRSANNVPGRKLTNVSAPGAPGAKRDLDRVSASANGIDNRVPITVATNPVQPVIDGLKKVIATIADIDTYVEIVTQYVTKGKPPGGGGGSWAAGGAIVGAAGSSRSGTADDIAIRASHGEYVVRAASVRALGVQRLDYINATGSLPGFKKGGQVKAAAPAAKPAPPKPAAAAPKAAAKPAAKVSTAARPAAKSTPGLGVPNEPWADARWRDYNQPPSLAPVPADPGPRPKKKKNEKDAAYQRRLTQWQRARDSRNSIIQDNTSKTADWNTTLARERLDYKWALSDAAAADAERRQQEAAQAAEEATRTAAEAAAEAARKAQEEADAREAAAEAARQAAEQHRSDALAEYRSFQDEARAGIGSGMASMKSFASVSGFDLNAASQAQEALAQARAAVTTANSPAERQAAIQAVSDAEAKAADAALTPASVTKRLQDKLGKIRAFRDALTTLKNLGLNPTTLSEVAQMDPDSGVLMADALKASNLAEINSLQSDIVTAGAEYGVIAHNANLGAEQTATNVMTSVIGRGGVQTSVNVTSQLFLDGKQVYESLLAYERQRGSQLWSN